MFNISASRLNILRNLGWSVLGKVVNLTGSLLVGVIVARYLGPEQYGLMNYVISYVFLFQTFAVFGLDNIEVREEARNPEQFRTILGSAFCIRVFFALVAMAAVAFTAWQFEADRYTFLVICLYSLSILLTSFNVIRNYFISIVQNEYVVKSEINRTLVGMAIKIALYFAGMSLTWFMVAYTFDYVLLAGGYIVSYQKKIGRLRDWKYDRDCSRLLIRESFPLMLTSAAVIVYQRIDQVMIGKLINNESVGYFGTASRIVEVLIYVPMMLAQTIAPVLTSCRERSEADYFKKAQVFMDISLWLSILLAVATSLASYWIIVPLFGEKYAPAVVILQVMAFKAASVALSNTAGTMLVVEGLQKWAICRDLFGCIVCVALNLWLLPKYGFVAAAFVAIASNVAAGYLADLFIPSYRHLFKMQTKALFLGWRSFLQGKKLLQA